MAEAQETEQTGEHAAHTEVQKGKQMVEQGGDDNGGGTSGGDDGEGDGHNRNGNGGSAA